MSVIVSILRPYSPVHADIVGNTRAMKSAHLCKDISHITEHVFILSGKNPFAQKVLPMLPEYPVTYVPGKDLIIMELAIGLEPTTC